MSASIKYMVELLYKYLMVIYNTIEMNDFETKCLTLGLIDFKFPKNEKRGNIMNGRDKVYKGFVCGLVNLRPYIAHKYFQDRLTVPSKMLKKKKYSDLFDYVCEYMDKWLKINDPEFIYTSIQFNKNYRCAKHKDRYNIGESYILGLGDYKGGELLIYDANGENPVTHNLKNNFVKFNGAIYPHETKRFKGNRITLVFYNIGDNGLWKKKPYCK